LVLFECVCQCCGMLCQCVLLTKKLLLDYAFRDEWIHRRSADSKAAWFQVVASAVEPRMRDSISASISQSASLSLCLYTPPLFGLPPYLDDRSNLPSSRLLTGARLPSLGHLIVMVTVGRLLGWPKERAQCVLCQGGLESVSHFLRDCVSSALPSQVLTWSSKF
jgi:hypothetical protein